MYFSRWKWVQCTNKLWPRTIKTWRKGHHGEWEELKGENWKGGDGSNSVIFCHVKDFCICPSCSSALAEQGGERSKSFPHAMGGQKMRVVRKPGQQFREEWTRLALGDKEKLKRQDRHRHKKWDNWRATLGLWLTLSFIDTERKVR